MSNTDTDGFLPDAAWQSARDEIVIHTEPRISAPKLAEYMIADPYRQKTILRDCKFAKKAIILHYKRTREFIPRAFSEKNLDIDRLVRRAEEIERENNAADISDWQRLDNTISADALRKIADASPELSWPTARMLHVRFDGLEFAGVKVSIRPEVVFAFEHRNITKIGGIILNTAKGEDKTLARKNGDYCVGDYLSSLLFQMLTAKAGKFGVPLNTKCYALDVFRGAHYTAPASYRRLNRNLEAACEMIASCWGSIKQPA